MKIGIIYTAYNMEEYIDPSLACFHTLKHMGVDLSIVAVSVRFAGFPEEAKDNTRKELIRAYGDGILSHVITHPDGISEVEARNKALQLLKSEGVEIIMQVDADEFFTVNDFNRIMAFVESQPFVAWFRLSLKNFVFDERTYLVVPFTPPRIHRVKTSDGLILHRFTDDNDICYINNNSAFIDPRIVPSMTIPPVVAWIKHFSWLNNERSRKKVLYQQSRGWTCDFAWDEKTGLIWNEKAFVNKTKPVTASG